MSVLFPCQNCIPESRTLIKNDAQTKNGAGPLVRNDAEHIAIGVLGDIVRYSKYLVLGATYYSYL